MAAEFCATYSRMKILMPIVGTDRTAGDNQYIKNLYEIQKKTVLQYVYESLSTIKGADFIVVIRKEDAGKFHLDDMVKLMIPDVRVIIADGGTKGSACSCLLAVDELEEDEPLIIAGGDQLVLADLQKVVDAFAVEDYDGGVIIFDDIHPRWSYVKLDENDMVIEAAEKRPISRNATTGFYYFKKSKYFVEGAQNMIKKGACVNNQYYVCPVYNEMVLKHLRIGSFRIKKEEYFNFNGQKRMNEYEKYLEKGLENVQF